MCELLSEELEVIPWHRTAAWLKVRKCFCKVTLVVYTQRSRILSRQEKEVKAYLNQAKWRKVNVLLQWEDREKLLQIRVLWSTCFNLYDRGSVEGSPPIWGITRPWVIVSWGWMTYELTCVCVLSCKHSMGGTFPIFQIWCKNIKSEMLLPGDIFHFQSLLWLTWFSVLLNVCTWCWNMQSDCLAFLSLFR